MQASRTHLRGRLSVLLALIVSLAGLQALVASPVQAASGTVVISEVFGANSATNLYNTDYVELHNPTGGSVSLAGMSVQYRSATSASGASSKVDLSGSIPAGGHVLVGGATTAGGNAIPAPDFSNTGMNLSGTAGVAILANTQTLLTNAAIGAGPSIVGTPGTNAQIQDLVGYGTANIYETAAAPAPSTTTVIQRTASDNDNNSAEFASSATGSPTNNSGPSPLAASDPGDKVFTQNQAIAPFNMTATGGTSPYTWSDPSNSLAATGGLSVNAAGQVSGTPTTVGTHAVTLLATDSAAPTAGTDDVTFNITVNAPGALEATDPGAKTGTQNEAITNFQMAATGGTPGYTWSDPGTTLPAGVTVNAAGLVSGTPTGTGISNVVLRVTDSTSAFDDVPFTFTISAAGAVKTIAELQGTGARSSFAPASGIAQGTETVTTEGVVTAVHKRGFASTGTPSAETCGFCGFTIQTGGSGGAVDGTPGASDAIFVFGGTSPTTGFNGLNSLGNTITIGDSVRVTGKVAEFGSTNVNQDQNSLTQIVYTGQANVVPIAALSPITKQTTLPTVYSAREAHESELFAPTDVVVTDMFNFETFGEFGLATGNQTLTQPTEICADDDTPCITAAQTDIRNRGYFLEDGTSTSYLTSSTYYRPHLSANSDIPLPFMDADNPVRIGANVTYLQGGVLEFRNRKWYLNPPRAVLSTHNGTPDLGADVLDFEDTRADNLAPANVGGDLKLATYNVENYFNTTGAQFAAANPYYQCTFDFDRAAQPIAVNECNAEDAIPNGWDPVTNAITSYGPGLVSAPRGAWRQEDLDRQTDKIVTAINGLGADIVSLQELGNPNKLRMGVTRGPLDPDSTKADSGFGTQIAWRDEAINYLVNALNTEAGAGTWAFVASPEESTDATAVPQMCSTVQPNGAPVPGPAATAGTCSWASGQDVIRSGFIYKRATVVPVGASDLDLPNSSAPVPSPFDNAREPLAQFFKPVGHPNSDGFAVIANHFKSKGDSDPDATGGNANTALTGAFNLARVNQAKELVRFAGEFAAKWNTDKVFLVGDINAYSKEDPILAILNDPLNTLGGFTKLTSSDPQDTSYMFSHVVDDPALTGEPAYGAKGSLDHVFASAGVLPDVTGVDIWEINANESSAFNFGRFNTNKTLFLNANDPFAGSDHNPEIIGVDVDGAPSVRDIQIIGSNDFHGRLVASTSDGGAAQLAGAVKSLKDVYSQGETPGNPNSVFVAAGDLIGASTFESFIDKDKPTLKALNAAGLEISSIGNHEFDQGVDDLVNRVMKPYDATTNPDGIPGGLDWDYIGANVEWTIDPDAGGPIEIGDPVVVPTAMKDFGGGIKIGFVGAVTEDLPNLVAPSALTGVQVNPIAAAVNTQALGLVNDGADVIVLLVHEGAPSTNCATMDQGDSAFAELLGDLAPNIDAVISGHTHLEYSCSFTVPEWAGDPITKRPVLSAGQYGVALDQLVYSFDLGTGQPVAVTHNNVGVKGPGSTLFSYPEDAAVKQIVDDAVAAAAAPGAVVLGKIAGPFKRARLADTTTENRGGESTLGNLVAEIQRAETPAGGPIAPAQIAFMNPGGLRDDLVGQGAGVAKDVTFKQAAAVQPFANTLVNMDLTGAQIKAVLEQQWQRDPGGNVPSRPFLRLGTSKGFTYTYTEVTESSGPANGAKKGTVTSMWLNGDRVTMAGVYSVTMNSFLASGGDNFRAFLNGVDKRDTGVTDLQAQVDYFAENATPASPLAVDYGQHAVRATFPVGAPASYGAGDTVEFDLASLAMSAVDDVKDTAVKVRINGVDVATGIPVTNTLSSSPNDEAGTASVSFEMPPGLPSGTTKVHVIGNNTGTDVIVPVETTFVEPATRDIQIIGTNDFHGRIANEGPSSTAAGAGAMAKAVKGFRAANPDTVFAAAGDLIGASTFDSFIDKDKPTIDALNSAGLEVSAAGNHEFDQGYDDLVNRVMAPHDASTNPKGGANWEYIAANIRKNSDSSHALAPSWVKEFGSVKVGFVGAITEHLPELVSPGGISTINVTDVVTEVNAEADALKADGADLVVMLVHEGAPGTDCVAMGNLAPDTDFGSIIKGVNDNVDAIVSGHTHLAYNCEFDVPGWSARPVTKRPVVSAGQYGSNLNRLVFTVDTATGQVQAKTQEIVRMKTCAAANGTSCGGTGQPGWVDAFTPPDGPTQAIVDAAVANADVLGAVPLGEIAGPFKRGKLADNTTENRGAESTLGNLVAEVQRWATRNPESGSAQLAFMNPGGLRADMVGTGSGSFPRTLTYKQAATVQSFANTLVNMDLTGAQIKATLEQQWQPGGASRPFLKLGISKGFRYTYDPTASQGNRITGMWLNGTPIGLGTSYSVTVNSFLSTGGDNFSALNGGTGKQDTGQTDLQAMVDYMDEFANTAEGDVPLPVDYKQNSVGITFPAGAPGTPYPSATKLTFDVSSWSMTNTEDVKDSEVIVKLGSTTIGTSPLDNAPQPTLPGFDETGKTSVDLKIPATYPVGPATVTLLGASTGTERTFDITVAEGQEITAGDVSIAYGEVAPLVASVVGNHGTPTGTVEFFEGATSLGTAPLTAGTATLDLAARSLPAGPHSIRAEYSGGGGYDAGSTTFLLTIAKATVTVNAPSVGMTYGKSVTVPVTVAPGATGVVSIRSGATTVGSAAVNGSGVANVVLPAKSLLPGARALTADYPGDDNHQADSDPLTVNVAKATSTVTMKITPAKIKKNVTRAKVKITVSAVGVVPTGKVKVKVKGQKTVTAVLGNTGKAVVKLKKFGSVGKKKVKVKYLGDTFVLPDSAKSKLTVTV